MADDPFNQRRSMEGSLHQLELTLKDGRGGEMGEKQEEWGEDKRGGTVMVGRGGEEKRGKEKMTAAAGGGRGGEEEESR